MDIYLVSIFLIGGRSIKDKLINTEKDYHSEIVTYLLLISSFLFKLSLTNIILIEV